MIDDPTIRIAILLDLPRKYDQILQRSNSVRSSKFSLHYRYCTNSFVVIQLATVFSHLDLSQRPMISTETSQYSLKNPHPLEICPLHSRPDISTDSRASLL